MKIRYALAAFATLAIAVPSIAGAQEIGFRFGGDRDGGYHERGEFREHGERRERGEFRERYGRRDYDRGEFRGRDRRVVIIKRRHHRDDD